MNEKHTGETQDDLDDRKIEEISDALSKALAAGEQSQGSAKYSVNRDDLVWELVDKFTRRYLPHSGNLSDIPDRPLTAENCKQFVKAWSPVAQIELELRKELALVDDQLAKLQPLKPTTNATLNQRHLLLIGELKKQQKEMKEAAVKLENERQPPTPDALSDMQRPLENRKQFTKEWVPVLQVELGLRNAFTLVDRQLGKLQPLPTSLDAAVNQQHQALISKLQRRREKINETADKLGNDRQLPTQKALTDIQRLLDTQARKHKIQQREVSKMANDMVLYGPRRTLPPTSNLPLPPTTHVSPTPPAYRQPLTEPRDLPLQRRSMTPIDETFADIRAKDFPIPPTQSGKPNIAPPQRQEQPKSEKQQNEELVANGVIDNPYVKIKTEQHLGFPVSPAINQIPDDRQDFVPLCQREKEVVILARVVGEGETPPANEPLVIAVTKTAMLNQTNYTKNQFDRLVLIAGNNAAKIQRNAGQPDSNKKEELQIINLGKTKKHQNVVQSSKSKQANIDGSAKNPDDNNNGTTHKRRG